MPVGELARALGVPRDFVYRRAAELGAICLCLPTPTIAIHRSSNAADRCASYGAHGSLSNDPFWRPPLLAAASDVA